MTLDELINRDLRLFGALQERPYMTKDVMAVGDSPVTVERRSYNLNRQIFRNIAEQYDLTENELRVRLYQLK